MLREEALRRPDFQPGLAIRLGDDQAWTLPGPGCPGMAGAEYESLLAALSEAEDEPERRRAELALAIYLLDWNYCLTPEEFGAILDGPPGGPRSVRMQEAFRTVASCHLSRRRGDDAPRSSREAQSPVSWRSDRVHRVG